MMSATWLVSAALLAAAVAAEPLAPLPDPEDLRPHAGMPDPLVRLDGRRTATRAEWHRERRAELRRLFQHYMYGRLPGRPARMQVTQEVAPCSALGGAAAMRVVRLRPGPAGTPYIRVLLLTPANAAGPAPLFLCLSFTPVHTVIADDRVPLPPGADPAQRGASAGVWNPDLVIGRGYALAVMYNADIEPDRPDAPEGIRARWSRTSGPEGQHDAGAIAAWAWGLSRVVDYVRRVREVDARRIAVVGHSRNGKAALVAAAFDDRIALVIPNQAGCGGTAPSRGTVGESVRQINTAFPHWFNARFKQFNDAPQRLPFDQNALVALVAPRPVLFTNAEQDQWANPDGQFEVLKAANPVYRFLGVAGLETEQRPALGTLSPGRLGYFIRPGQHSMTRADWEIYLAYADRWLKP